MDGGTARALSRQQQDVGTQSAPCWSQRQRGPFRVLPWSRAPVDPTPVDPGPACAACASSALGLRPPHRAGLPHARRLVARTGRGGPAVRRRARHPLAPRPPASAWPTASASSSRRCSWSGVYVGNLPWIALATLEALYVALMCAVTTVVQRPLLDRGLRPLAYRRGAAGLGAAGVGARHDALRRLPVGPAGVQPGRQPARAVRPVRRCARA